MKKKATLTFFCLLLIILVGCATTGQVPTISQYEVLFEDYRSYGGTVYMGISGPYTDQEVGMQKAKEACAKMMALCECLAMQSDVDLVFDSSHSYESFIVKNQAVYLEELYQKALAEMEIVQSKWYGKEVGGAVFALNKGADKLSWKQDWIENTPGFSGKDVRVGTAFTYYYLHDSLQAAAFEGAVALSDGHGRTVTANSELIETRNEEFSRDLYQINLSILEGFRVLDYQYDAKQRSFSALVIANR